MSTETPKPKNKGGRPPKGSKSVERQINEQLSESIKLIGRMQGVCLKLVKIVDALPEETPAETIVKLADSFTGNATEIAKASETLVKALRGLNAPHAEDDEWAGKSGKDILRELAGGGG